MILTMDFTLVIYMLSTAAILIGPVSSQGNILEIDVTPSNKIAIGNKFTVTCTLNQLQSTYSMVWKRKLGDLETILGNDGRIDSDFLKFPRYNINTGSKVGNKQSYSLSVLSAGYEDTATYECSLRGSDVSASLVVAVCEDTSLYSCGCMLSKPLDPDCFEEPYTVQDVEANCQKVNIGLGVLLAIAVIYGVLMTVILGKDYLKHVNDHNKERLTSMMRSTQGVQQRQAGYQLSETTALDETASNLDITMGGGGATDSPARLLGGGRQGADEEEEEEIQVRPKQVGRQGERRRQHTAPGNKGQNNAGYNNNDEVVSVHNTSAGPPTGRADIGYAPYPSNATTNYVEPPSGGARQKQYYNQPSPRPVNHPTSPSPDNTYAQPIPTISMPTNQLPYNNGKNSALYNEDLSQAPPRYNDAETRHPTSALERPPVYDNAPSSTQSARYGSSSSAADQNEMQGVGGRRSPRGAYTDVPVGKSHGQGRGTGYTEPKRLDFQNGKSSSRKQNGGQNQYGNQGAFVDNSSTAI